MSPMLSERALDGPPVLRIAESGTAIYFYHLVEATTVELKQGQLTAICGKGFHGWETKWRMAGWGQKDHIPSIWCPGCDAIHRA